MNKSLNLFTSYTSLFHPCGILSYCIIYYLFIIYYYSQVHNSSSLGLYSGVAVRGQGPGNGKLVIGGSWMGINRGILSYLTISGDNLVKQCDVGIHVADNCAPAIRCGACYLLIYVDKY